MSSDDIDIGEMERCERCRRDGEMREMEDERWRDGIAQCWSERKAGKADKAEGKGKADKAEGKADKAEGKADKAEEERMT